MSQFTITLSPHSHDFSAKFRWCLDLPSPSEAYQAKVLIAQGVNIKGWFLKKKGYHGRLALVQEDQITFLENNEKRNDVVEKIVSKSEIWERTDEVGFNHFIKLKSSTFTLGLFYDSRYTVLYTGTVKGAFDVLRGKKNWLYLDNDTNKSVEQFIGKVRLSRSVKAQWKAYMRAFCSLANELDVPFVFMVAPSKELVVLENYPFDKPRNTPLEQVKRIAIDSFPILTFIDTLRNSKHRTFRVCDTHWSAHGAMLATVDMAVHLGLPEHEVKATFEKDLYRDKEVGGDLGSKLFPPETHVEQMLVSYDYKTQVLFDNKLPNFGRTVLIENHEALSSKTIVLFGSSSAYSMFNYISRIFRFTFFCHCAGSIDQSLLMRLKPDCIATQSNARFLVRAPSHTIDIKSLIAAKREGITTSRDERESSSLPSSERAKFLLAEMHRLNGHDCD